MSDHVAPRLLTRTELAGAFAVHPLTITTWGEQGMPTAERGTRGRASRYALPDCVRWYIARELAARGAGNGDGVDPVQERALLDRRRREALEFATAIKQGEWVRLRDVELRWARVVVETRNALRAFPSRARSFLGLSPEATREFSDWIDLALGELADQHTPDEEAKSDAAETNGNARSVHQAGANDSGALAAALP